MLQERDEDLCIMYLQRVLLHNTSAKFPTVANWKPCHESNNSSCSEHLVYRGPTGSSDREGITSIETVLGPYQVLESLRSSMGAAKATVGTQKLL